MKPQPKFKKGDLIKYKVAELFAIRGFGIIKENLTGKFKGPGIWYSIHWQNATASKGYANETEIEAATRAGGTE